MTAYIISQALAGAVIVLDIVSGQFKDRKKILAGMLAVGVMNGTHFF